MTKDEAMDLALEALEYASTGNRRPEVIGAALTAIKQARSAPVQEPHSWYSAEHDEWMTDKTRKEHERLNSYTHKVGGFDLPLYTTPPAAQRQWVGLTDEEYAEAEKCVWAVVSLDDTEKEANREFARAIEAKLKEKNT